MVIESLRESALLKFQASIHPRSVRYFSFDVFDTCVTRYCINPPDLFESLFSRLLGQLAEEKSYLHQAATEPELKSSGKLAAAEIETAAKMLARSRIQAEREARSQVASDDVSLAQIYQTFAPSLEAYGIDPADALTEEIEIELAAVSPILSTRNRIQRLREKGHTIVFISDMYLPGSVVRQMLIEHKFSDGSDGVYVSADIGFSKGSGRLFTYVCNQLCISPKQLHHTGDNAYADIRAAQKLGIRTTYFTQGDRTAYEQGFRSELLDNDWMSSYLVGVSRAIRLRHDSGVSDTHQHATVAADVLAPLLTSYVIWVLTTAQQTGIQQLHFAEEGLFAIAQTILYQWQQQRNSGLNVESLPTCYWRSPAPESSCHTQALVRFETHPETYTETKREIQPPRYGYTFSLLNNTQRPLTPGPMRTRQLSCHLSYLEAPITPYKHPEGTLYLFEYRQILQRFLHVLSTATLPIYRTVVLDYAATLARLHPSGDQLYAMLKRYATRNAIIFFASPSPADVASFTNLQIAADAHPVALVARPVHLLALPAFSRQLLKGAYTSGTRWIEGSIAISPYAIRFLLMNLRRIYRWLTQHLAPWRGKKIF